MSYDPVVRRHLGVDVVRDDLVPGGSKRPLLGPVLAARPASEYVFAGPVYGYAQIALAYAAAERGAKATIFVAQRKVMHARTAEALAAGAKIVEVPTGYLSNCRSKARAYAAERGAVLLPFGFDLPEMHEGIVSRAHATGASPREVWCVAGSGALTRALQAAWPDARHHAVIVGAQGTDTGAAVRHLCTRPFASDARDRPPFPSVSNYDAKAWAFIRQYAAPRALFWNVGA